MFRRYLIRHGLLLLLPLMAWSVTAASQDQSPSDTKAEEPFAANDRLEIPPIHNPLRVAEPNQIPVVLHGPGLKTILSMQSIDRDERDPYGMQDGEQTLELLHRADGSTYVNIVPIRLGKLTIRITASFVDGRIADQTVIANVGPSQIRPATLALNALFIDLTDSSPTYIEPVAYYYGLRTPIVVPPRFLMFDEKTLGVPPLIKIDPATGKVTPLHAGDALVETSFSGAVMHTCVQVRNAPYSADVSNRNRCKELRHLDRLAASMPLNQTWGSDPGENLSFFGSGMEFFTERLSVVAPERPVGLAQHIQIPIRLSDDKVRYVVFRQWIYNNGFDTAVPTDAMDANGARLSANDSVPIGEERMNPVKEGGETGKFVEIIPLALGEVEVGIAVHFQDGGFAERFFRMKVMPSSKGLKLFQGYQPEQLQPAEGPERRQSTQLIADLTYEGFSNPIRLSNLQGVKFAIQQAKGPAVVAVNGQGEVRALRPGDAVVIVDFDGVTWPYPIHVSETQHSAAKHRAGTH